MKQESEEEFHTGVEGVKSYNTSPRARVRWYSSIPPEVSALLPVLVTVICGAALVGILFLFGQTAFISVLVCVTGLALIGYLFRRLLD